jgi:hypothetical protein
MRRVFRRLIRRVNTTEWSVSWFEVLPGEEPSTIASQIDSDPGTDLRSVTDTQTNQAADHELSAHDSSEPRQEETNDA